ncbi:MULTISPECIES: hypothetical protein [unclassified Rathayibacter]|uniref:hypothetical protein n=1 Tax=unclassified Rathayibacter TaxID=2609250 RepID=UPI000CE836E0|nr:MULTISPECIES: hypothetical protein [unclassified Rathayibacter]PPI34887.1 hypothetical protein C5D50_15790 [Rathayibacter sp. RFBD1]PPI51713.1 hypothetical protein C5D38_15345 [Rathayibacter sp. TRS19]
MTTHTTDTTGRGYTARLRRELAVLPRRSRRELLEDASEHAVGDESELARSFGDPVEIARAALDQHDARTGRPMRPSLLLPSKLLQLGAAVLTGPFAAIALLDLLLNGTALGLPRLALWALIALPPLLARWTTWWRVSLACAALHACYLAVAAVVTLGGGNVPAPAVALLLSAPVALAQLLALGLSAVALLRAPRVLRAR